jgi:membrane protein implicated in regulation of membrane protease activity
LDPGFPTTFFWLSAAAIFLLAGLAHGVLGLGFPMLATPLLAILVDIRSAVLSTLPFVAIAAAALLLGTRFRDRMGGDTYRRWLRKLLVGMAVVLVAQFVNGLWSG